MGRKKKYTAEEFTEAYYKYRTARDVAAQLSMDVLTVYKYARDFNLPRKGHQKPRFSQDLIDSPPTDMHDPRLQKLLGPKMVNLDIFLSFHSKNTLDKLAGSPGFPVGIPTIKNRLITMGTWFTKVPWKNMPSVVQFRFQKTTGLRLSPTTYYDLCAIPSEPRHVKIMHALAEDLYYEGTEHHIGYLEADHRYVIATGHIEPDDTKMALLCDHCSVPPLFVARYLEMCWVKLEGAG